MRNLLCLLAVFISFPLARCAEAGEANLSFPLRPFQVLWRPAGMSRHNQKRSAEEGRSLLGGTHAIKSVKPSVDILEGLSTGVNMDVSAPHLIHKWLNESRQSPSF
jgi:hypothetical protein